MDNLRELAAEYLKPVEANNSLTNEQKKVISENVKGFVDFIEAQQRSHDEQPKEPDVIAPVLEVPEHTGV